MISIEATIARACATFATAGVLAQPPTNFIWDKKTQLQWSDDIALMNQLGTAEVLARTLWRNAAEAWQGSLERIQHITRLVATLGEVHFREDAALAKSFQKLKTNGRSRAAMHKQGKAALAAWQSADPGWIVKDDENEYSSSGLGSLLAAADAQGTTHDIKLAGWRKTASTLMNKARALDRDNIQWYRVVTRKFPAGTTAGDTIRSTVPTSYTPQPKPAQAQITQVMADGRVIHLDVTAQNATKFTYLHQAPNAPAFVVVVTDSPLAHLTLYNQAPGLHRFKAIGRNARGEGEESAIVEVQVAVEEAA